MTKQGETVSPDTPLQDAPRTTDDMVGRTVEDLSQPGRTER